MKLSSIFIILLSLVGSSAFVGAVKTPSSFVLAVPRGGAGPLDPTVVAKTTATGTLAVHLLSALGPEKALRTYGVEHPTPVNVFVAQREWTFFLAASLMGYLTIVHDQSVNSAVGYGTFPIILEVLRSILNDEQEKLGISNVAQLVVVLAPLVVNSYACLVNTEQANTVTMVCGAYNILKGIWYFLDTENSGKTWGLKGETDPYSIGSAKWMGISLIVYGGGLVGLAREVDVKKLAGYSWIPVILNMINETFITKVVDTYGLNKSLFYMWMILGAAVIGTLAFD